MRTVIVHGPAEAQGMFSQDAATFESRAVGWANLVNDAINKGIVAKPGTYMLRRPDSERGPRAAYFFKVEEGVVQAPPT